MSCVSFISVWFNVYIYIINVYKVFRKGYTGVISADWRGLQVSDIFSKHLWTLYNKSENLERDIGHFEDHHIELLSNFFVLKRFWCCLAVTTTQIFRSSPELQDVAGFFSWCLLNRNVVYDCTFTTILQLIVKLIVW